MAVYGRGGTCAARDLTSPTAYATSPPIAATITSDEIIVTLEDGRKISNPLDWFPWLRDASPEQRDNYELWPFSIDWPDLDNGLDVEGMLRGIRPKTHPHEGYSTNCAS